jgi:molybdopterin converting factor small subunit
MWKGFGKAKGPGAVFVAVALAIATVVPGGAFTSSASAQGTEAFADGLSFRAFVSALADEAVQGAVDQVKAHYASLAPVLEAATGDPNFGAGTVNEQLDTVQSSARDLMNDALAQLPDEVDDNFEDVDVPEVPGVDLGDLQNQADGQEAELANADSDDVIAALLGLLNPTEAQVLAALAAAEAAVLAKIDDAKVKTIAALALVDLGAQEAFILSQIDAARAAVVQAFAMIRAQVIAAFAQARNAIVEELTGVDFGDAVDEVLAMIADIQSTVNSKLAQVQNLIDQLDLGL